MTRRIEHVVAFGILGVMLLSLCRNSGQKWVVTLALLCLACGLELRQHQLFRQPFEWWDVRDDGIGLLLALLLLRFTRIRALLVR
ncbi:MAG: VanZ family protein [Bryobacteraceae bacterium]|jgi:VanZ family protein